MENYGEYKNTFIIAEEDSTDDKEFLKSHKIRISMNAIKRLIERLFKNETESRSNEIKGLKADIEKLENTNKELKKAIEELQKECNRIKETVERLNNSDKSEKTRLVNAYRAGITAFCSINDDVYQSFGRYARSKKLHILEKILSYLYSPTKDIEMEIRKEMEDHDIRPDLKKWLEEINEFGEKGRKDIEKYLETSNKHFADYLIFPEEHTFQKGKMESRNGTDISEGEEVYIIKLGFVDDLPDSSTPHQKAVVFSKNKYKSEA